jgi:hypothetical protein
LILNKEKMLKWFQKQKVTTVQKLCQLLKCSIPSVRNILKQWRTHTSCNQNGRYYTLWDIPEFNVYGLWRYEKILFSRWGNLRKTFVTLVEESQAGLNASELSSILGMPAMPFLSHFKEDDRIRREKAGGVYIYYASAEKIFERQRQEREKEILKQAGMERPSDAEAVQILVERIKHPQDTVERLNQRLSCKGVSMGSLKIHHFLMEQGLLKKKLWISSD